MNIGLRIDVDTLRGTRYGVPSLCRVLAAHSVRATFFFSVGPDNMGRNLWRLLNPAFLSKMLRTEASDLYGWDILLMGTLGPGPLIWKRTADVIHAAAKEGHEVGLHAWDHYRWQRYIEKMDALEIFRGLETGFKILTDITGSPPVCSAAPAWKCTDEALRAKSGLPFLFNSDCRGKSVFLPVPESPHAVQPQIPVTLPTYDEVIGKDGITDSNYNDYLLSVISEEGINVLTIHAEVEGIARLKLFGSFMKKAREKGVTFSTLGDLLPLMGDLNSHHIEKKEFSGREGWVSVQMERKEVKDKRA